MLPQAEIIPADIHWDDSQQPISTTFNDVYFCKSHGLNETRHVFLQHNQLAERFAALPSNSVFIIGETGFGTGLNFLACWQLWQQTAPSDAHLHFISTEKHPLTSADLRQALALWPELAPLATALLAVYPPVFSSPCQRLVCNPRVSLTLLFGDATESLHTLLAPTQLSPQMALAAAAGQLHLGGPPWAVDAWFLDGFAPAKNPSLWQAELFYCLARLSKPGTTFATFTAAASVKKGLEGAGFTWQKVRGFGRKRDMLKGELRPLSPWRAASRRSPNQWQFMATVCIKPQAVAVVGAGLAGAHTAYALAKAGVSVTVFEQGEVANGGSGNPQGVVYAKLSHKPEAFADFNLIAFLFACQFYHQQGFFKQFGDACGVLQLLTNKEQALFHALKPQLAKQTDFVQWLEPQQASECCGLPVDKPALYFPQSGWLNPKQLCQKLLQHPNIRVLPHTPIDRMHFEAPHWHLSTQQGAKYAFSHVVVACAHQAQGLLPFAHITTKAIRGQVTFIQPSAHSRALKTVLCGEGYLAPAQQQLQSLGASFNPNSTSTALLIEDTLNNLARAQALSPSLSHLQAIGDRAAVRTASRDYLPLLGPVAMAEPFAHSYSALRTNLKASIDTPAPYWPGLYLNSGHGSRGLTYTPLCAAILSSLMLGEPLPVNHNTFLQLHPTRFLVRDLARKRL